MTLKIPVNTRPLGEFLQTNPILRELVEKAPTTLRDIINSRKGNLDTGYDKYTLREEAITGDEQGQGQVADILDGLYGPDIQKAVRNIVRRFAPHGTFRVLTPSLARWLGDSEMPDRYGDPNGDIDPERLCDEIERPYWQVSGKHFGDFPKGGTRNNYGMLKPSGGPSSVYTEGMPTEKVAPLEGEPVIYDDRYEDSYKLENYRRDRARLLRNSTHDIDHELLNE